MKTGIDTVEVLRIKKLMRSDKFFNTCFTDSEIKYFMTKPIKARAQSVSGHFAVKEAVAKALGTGLMREGVGLKDIEIVHNESGTPSVVLSSGAKEKLKAIGTSIEISITHTNKVATAICNIL